MTWEDAHQTRARINSATVAGVTMREARGQRPFQIKVYEGARGRDLIRIPMGGERRACVHALEPQRRVRESCDEGEP